MTQKLLRSIAPMLAVIIAATACGATTTTESATASPVLPGEELTASTTSATTTSSTAALDAPGVVYFTTQDGELRALVPATGDITTVWDPTDHDGRNLAIEVAATSQSDGVHLLMAGAEQQLDTSLQTMSDGTLRVSENSEENEGAVCVDPHAQPAATVAHRVVPSFDNSQGTGFVQAIVDGDPTSIIELTRKSTSCPRYNSTRDVVMTSNLTTPNDIASESIFVDGPTGNHQISIDGCAMGARTFSPDDEWALVSIMCFDELWQDSGLYAIPMVDVATVEDLDDMVRIVGGNFARTAWHPDGAWIVATRYEPVPQQTPELDVVAGDVSLVVINTSGEAVPHSVSGAHPHSIIWASESHHSTP